MSHQTDILDVYQLFEISTVAKKRSVLSPRIFQIFSKTILLLAVSGDYVRFLLAPASLSLAMDIAGVD
jgi:hypothetical protein